MDDILYSLPNQPPPLSLSHTHTQTHTHTYDLLEGGTFYPGLYLAAHMTSLSVGLKKCLSWIQIWIQQMLAKFTAPGCGGTEVIRGVGRWITPILRPACDFTAPSSGVGKGEEVCIGRKSQLFQKQKKNVS